MILDLFFESTEFFIIFVEYDTIFAKGGFASNFSQFFFVEEILEFFDSK